MEDIEWYRGGKVRVSEEKEVCGSGEQGCRPMGAGRLIREEVARPQGLRVPGGEC